VATVLMGYALVCRPCRDKHLERIGLPIAEIRLRSFSGSRTVGITDHGQIGLNRGPRRPY
jgi:hypothetical protein